MKVILGTKIDSNIHYVFKKFVTKLNNDGMFSVTAESFGGIKASDRLNDYTKEIDRFAKVNDFKVEYTKADYGDFSKSYTFKIEDALALRLIDKIIAN